MSALERAIAERRPDRSLGDVSPMVGLRRRNVGAVDVVAQSVAAVAPAGVILLQPFALGERAGSFAFLDLTVMCVIVVMLASTIAVFARRLASTGSLYTFAIRGLGRVAGITTGVALAAGYAAIALNTFVGAVRHAVALVAETSGAAPPIWVPMVVVVGFAAVIAAITIRGLRVSTRVMLVLESVAVAVVLAISLAVLASTGWNLTALVPDVSEPVDFGVVLSGVGVAVIAFVGFESGVSLGPETRRPLATIPRALRWTVIAISVVYLIGGAAQLSADADIERISAETTAPPLAQIAEGLGQPGLALITHLIVVLSFLACALACTTALSRLAFSMSREGVLPAWLGRTSRRGTPAFAGVLLAVMLGVVPFVCLLLTGSFAPLRGWVATTGVMGYVLAYVLVCIAVPVFLIRLGEFTWREGTVAVLTALALGAALLLHLRVVVASDPWSVAVPVAIGALIVALCLGRVRRHPEVAARLGLYDEPVAADSIGGGLADRRG